MLSKIGTKLYGLSDILLLDPKKLNPHADLAQRIAKQHCKNAGIYVPTFDGYNTMCAYLFPDASLERLVALIMIMNFFYFVDETYERHERQGNNKDEDMYLRTIFDNCVQVMLYGKLPATEHQLYRACLVIHRFVLPLTNETWLKNFISVTIQHLKSTTYTLEDILNAEGGDPIEQYVALRELDGGMRPTMRLIEFANNFYLSDEIKMHPYIRSVEEPTASIGGLMNDIFSYEKEVTAYGSRFNLVALLEDYHHLSFEKAVHQAVEIVNQHTRNFLAREQAIPKWENEETNQTIRRYVQCLRNQINATWHWQISTDRYRSKTSPFPELRIKA